MIYDVTKYNIIGDGVTNNTKKINKLISDIDGGTLYFPPGKYVTGSIVLKSNCSLWIESGAVILGSLDFNDFPYINSKEIHGYTRNTHCGLITAFNCENISIYGRGTIDARGKVWWDSGKSDYERPRTINPILCENVLVRDVTILNSPCWTVHPICCNNVNIDSITLKNPYDSPNTDGINPESCKNVRISNCHLDVGDDCITIKSGTETDLLQKQHPCENIVITGCTMAHGHGGIVIGSEMSGGVKNITVTNCVFDGTERGIRMKTRRTRGGYIEGIVISNIIMNNVLAAITANCYYYWGADYSNDYIFSQEKKPFRIDTPTIRDISISNVMARNIKGVGVYFYGLPESPISDIVINNTTIFVVGDEEGIDAVSAFNRDKSNGEGIFLENAQNIIMSNLNIKCVKDELTIKNCNNIFRDSKELSNI